MQKIKIEFSEFNGGEFTMGVVTDENKIDILREKAEEGDFSLSDLEEEGVAFYENDSFFHYYSGDVSDGNMIIYKNDEEILDLNVDEIPYTTYSNPWVNFEELQQKIDGDFLVFGAAVYEKALSAKVSFELEDDEEFDINKLLFLTINLDETFGDWQIIDKIVYFKDKDLKVIWDKVYEEYEKENQYYEPSEYETDKGKIEIIMNYYDDGKKDIKKMVEDLGVSIDFEEGRSIGSEAILIYDKYGEALFQQWN